MTNVTLTGLDGSNPLAFLAALGTLRALRDDARRKSLPTPRLSWNDDGAWRPLIHASHTMEGILDTLVEQTTSWGDEPALALAYEKGGARVDHESPGATRDLKPPPSVMRTFLDEMAGRSASLRDRRSADTVAALATDLAVDNKGNTKPTALHFTAGQQSFLEMIARLQSGVTRDDLTEALRGPWRGTSQLPSLSWNSTVDRSHALRASDPSKEKRGSVAGADWLAFLGLSFYPVALVGRTIKTPGFDGGWKDATFTWPLWICPADTGTIRSILSTHRLPALTPRDRDGRGFGVVFTSRVLRSDQGGYGSFAPARIARGGDS